MTTPKAHTMTSLDELDHAIGAAALDADTERLDALEQERDRLHRSAERQQLADAERQRRQIEADAAERAALLATLMRQRDDYRARFVETLNGIDTAPDKGPLVAAAYELGRQAYSLSHDLVSVTGDRQRFHLRYDVPDQLVLHGGRAAEAFLSSIRGRPVVVPIPWREDIARLRELIPRVERIGNGG